MTKPRLSSAAAAAASEADVTTPHLDRRRRAAARRLFLQSLLNKLTACWVAGLLACLAWFLITPLFAGGPPESSRRWVLTGTAAGGSFVAILWAVFTRPRPALALVPLLAGGLALVNDYYDPRPLFGAPTQADETPEVTDDEPTPPAAKRPKAVPPPERIDRPDKPQDLKDLEAELDRQLAATAEAGRDGKPGDAANQARDRLARMDELREQMREMAQDKAARLAALQERMDRIDQAERRDADELAKALAESDFEKARDALDRLAKKAEAGDLSDAAADQLKKQADRLRKQIDRGEFTEEQAKELQAMLKRAETDAGRLTRRRREEGAKPLDGLKDDLARMDFDKAGEKLQRLAEKAQQGELTEGQMKQLREQAERFRKALEEAGLTDKQIEKLKELIRKAEADGRDAEALKRELERLQEQAGREQDLGEMAGRLKKLVESLDEDDLKRAAELMKRMSAQMKRLGGTGRDLRDLQKDLQALRQARQLARRLGGQGRPSPRPSTGGQGRGTGKRPEADSETDSVEERLRALLDKKGGRYYAGAADGGGFKPATTEQLGDAIGRAAQDGPRSADVQRLPRDARDTVRDYFRILGKD